METDTLRKGLHTASGSEENELDKEAYVSPILELYYQKHENLRGVPADVIRKAWFTMAHMMVGPDSLVLDMGCNPLMTYAMAQLNPQINFLGVNLDKKLINGAKKNFELPNLEFRSDDIIEVNNIEEESVDGIINSFILHEIYSGQHYFDRAVTRALEKHFSLLKQEGLMFIRDFSMPPPGEYIMLEMPDTESKGGALSELSEPDLLVWYSQNARPTHDVSCTGFFLEELPPRFPETRLFRLPYKWAYEFIMRKDNRQEWEEELPKEYTFFTPREYRKNLRGLGARVLYTAPQWDELIIRERFDGHFRIYGDDGKTIGIPPTSFIAVAQKMGQQKSLHLHERRPSHKTDNNQIRITAMRNERTGQVFDIVSRDMDLCEILPYRVTPEGEINVFIHEGTPRGIANAVPRSGKELDSKRWSGHMTEAITVPSDVIYETEKGEPKATVLFSRDYLGLKPAMGCELENGPSFYPAPDYIDEHIKTRYLRVLEHEGGAIEPKVITADIEGFTTKGSIREVSAQSILNAISVGFIPNSRLESQLIALFDMLEIEPEVWEDCPLAIDVGTPEQMLDGKKLLELAAEGDKRYKDVKGTAGQLRSVRSIFVDEGWVNGGISGMASRDIEFVVSDDQTINKAVILPLTKDAETGDVCAGLNVEYMPVPQRHKGSSISLEAPSIVLPKEITTMEAAKKFIADQFNTTPDKVAKMGESYFCHLGVTPTRIFPFCVSTSGKRDGPLGGPVQYAPLDYIGYLFGALDNDEFMYSRAVLCRFKKAYYRHQFDSEVSGDWERNNKKIRQQTMKRTQRIFHGMHVSKESSSSNEMNAKPGVRYRVGGASKKTDKDYISSPDFVDIKHDAATEGATYSKHNKNDNKHDKDMDAKNKGGQNSGSSS